MNEAAATNWTCPTCHVTVASAFCSTCGEKPKDPRDFTLAGLAAMTFKAFSPVDGKVLRSFRRLLGRPGALTVAFQHGQRRPHAGPFQLFLLANVIFFGLQSLGATKIFTQPLAFRLKETEQGYAWSQILLNARLAETGKTFEQYAPIFDQAIEVNAKSMIGLMVPFFALCLPLIFPRRRQPIAVNMVFSLHYYAFVLLLLCVPLLLMELSGLVGGPAIAPRFADNAIGASLVLACAVYLYFAVGPVYGARGPARILQTALLAIATMAIFFGYRFVLMPITLYTT